MIPSLCGYARYARLRITTPQSTPMCGEVERGVQAVCMAVGKIYADLDRLT